MELKDPIRALLIDDEKTVLKSIKVLMSGKYEGIDITTSMNAKSALQKIKEANIYHEDDPYDVIISDLKMPKEMDGFELLEKIREMGVDKPFLIYTGKGTSEDKDKALELDANRYLEKSEGVGLDLEGLSKAIREEHEKYQEKQKEE